VLSELAEEWRAALERWKTINNRQRFRVDGQPVPDRNDEYVLYQTLLGVWPLEPLPAEDFLIFTQRIADYMQKASKEAKVHTSWINPNRAYDEALLTFVQTVLNDPTFVEDFTRFQHTVAEYGMYNAVSQTLLKLTVPGVPDIYQGNELWDFSLVDPDNRRPVDYALRGQFLDQLRQQIDAADGDALALRRLAQDLLSSRADGRIKLYVTYRSLTYRRAYPQLFLHGSYLPLESWGRKEQHVCAFARQHGQHTLIVVVPRFLSGVITDLQALPVGTTVWGETWLGLPEALGKSPFRNMLTGDVLNADVREGKMSLPLGDVLAHFPLALLESRES
jgi:(1->4)-alpha-D-glucan 1-alpha-D-glucosylmutase